jgi:serine/threonine protein kinase
VIAKRGPGVYQAPEVHANGERHVGTKSDIWSFGCIFVQILAFAIGGPSLVEDLDSKRRKMQDGETINTDDYFYRDGEINPLVRNWLIGLPSHDQVAKVILKNCQTLALDMLEISPEARPPASEVYEQLTRYDQLPKPCSNKLGARSVSSLYEARNQFFRTSQYERYKERNPARVKDTCQWFLQHSRYLYWRNSLTSRILWVSADPGCGKSVLARSLVLK